MSRLAFRLQSIPAASGSVVRIDTSSGSNTPADLRTLDGNAIDGAVIRSGSNSGHLPTILGPDGVTTLYQKTLDYRGQVTGSPVTLTGEDDNPAPSYTGGAATTNASLLTSGTLSAARLPDLSSTYSRSLLALSVDAYGADPTGVADSTAAFIAAQTAGGSNPYRLVLSVGTYKIGTSGNLLDFGRRQGMAGQGSDVTTINYVGTGTCVQALDGSFNTSLSNGGQFRGFSLSGPGAGTATVGLRWGGLGLGRGYDLSVTGFGTGFLFKNPTGSWSEQMVWTACRSTNCGSHVVFDTNSFDYSVFEFLVVAQANQNGVTIQNDAALEGVRFELRGNFYTGASSNSGHVIGVDPAGAGVGTARIDKAQMFVNVECDGAVGTVGHATLKLNGGSGSQFNGTGVLNFLTGTNAAPFQSMTRSGTLYGFSGVMSSPEYGSKPGDALSLWGGSQWNTYGTLTTAAYNTMLIYCQFGDVQEFQLPSGNIIISGFDGAQQKARRLELYFAQPSTGAAGTITWPSNVYFPGGAPVLSTANNAVDKVVLTYLPTENRWYGQAVTSYALASSATVPLFQPYLGIDGDAIANGDETQLRRWGGANMSTTSGTLYLSFFNARKSETKTKIAAFTNATAAAATPTYAAMGIYSVASTGALTLLGQCASDATLFGSAFAQNERTLTASVTTVAGQRYAFGLLVVSAAAMPTFYGANNSFALNYTAPPFMGATVTAQSTLPSSIASGGYTGANSQVYGWMHP